MRYIAATSEFGLIVRKRALAEKGVSSVDLSKLIEDVDVLAEDDLLISLGPLFGSEALSEIMKRLSDKGLAYVDDFFEMNFLTPSWLRLGVSSV